MKLHERRRGREGEREKGGRREEKRDGRRKEGEIWGRYREHDEKNKWPLIKPGDIPTQIFQIQLFLTRMLVHTSKLLG